MPKQYVKFLKKQGFGVEKRGNHLRVLHNGNYVSSLSTTGESNACRQNVRDLVRLGLLPESAKRLKW